ncbi:MAG: hypothetical protein ACLQUY_25965 [Ktedonobacterales bacterium]
MEESPIEDAQAAPPLPEIDPRKLYVSGLKAQADGDFERAEGLWQQILDRNKSYLNGLVERDLQALQTHLHPIRVKKLVEAADRARSAADWDEEVRSLKALVALEPQNPDWPKRLKSATQNQDNSELYEVVKELISEGARAEARERLELLWNNAPTFGDPSSLGPEVDFTYEEFHKLAESQAQQIREMLAEAEKELELAKAKRTRALIAWEKKTRRRRLTKNAPGDPRAAVLLYYFCLLVCLVIALGTLANHVPIPSNMTLPFHLSQLIEVAIPLILASPIFYFVAFSLTLPILPFLPVIAVSLGLGELFLQIKWSLVNPSLPVVSFPFWGRTPTSVRYVLVFILCEAVAGAIISLIIGLLLGVGLYAAKIRRDMKSAIRLCLLISVVITVSYVIVANIIGVTLGYVVAGSVIGLVTALAVVIRRADTHRYFFYIILPASILLSLLVRFVMSPLFGPSDVAAAWLAVSLLYALLLGFGAGKTVISSLLAIGYRYRLTRKKREGFVALALFLGYIWELPGGLTPEQLEELKPRVGPLA